MITRTRTIRGLVTLAAISIASSVGARGESEDLFTDVGSKQTAKDFEPAPGTIDAERKRAAKIRCAVCKLPGAGMGCWKARRDGTPRV